MKTLIIPDIHLNHTKAESFIDKEKPDKTVFLGDYFDDWYETDEDTHDTAAWLAKSVKKHNRIHLVGNHDLSYMSHFKCAGFNEYKQFIINKYKIDWSSLQPFAWIDNWLCTHAGLSNEFYNTHSNGKSPKEFVNTSHDALSRTSKSTVCHPLFDAGYDRGGTQKHGGIVWCDYSNFMDIPNVNQIFGHTNAYLVRTFKSDTAEHICLDTALRNYAVYEDGQMKVYNG